MNISEHQNVKGWGEDSNFVERPGVPAESEPPHPVKGAHWIRPEQQPLLHDVLKQPGRASYTPVFGTGPGLKGLSGVIRKFAHTKVQDHRPMKFMLLLLADRVDVMEHRFEKAPWALPLAAAGSLAAVFSFRLANRAR